MENWLDFIATVAPWAISIASVVVAGRAISANKRTAYRQAYFDKKTKAYQDFFEALSVLAYDQHNPAKRAALTNAIYCALLFSSKEAATGLNFVAQWALKARDREDISVLDAVLPNLRDELGRDLAHTWTKSISNMHEDLCEAKEQKTTGG